MRRLAVQSRDDTYSSKRDYQTIFKKNSTCLNFQTNITNKISFSLILPNEKSSTFVCAGGYFKGDDSECKITLRYSDLQEKITIQSDQKWKRFGLIMDAEERESNILHLELEFKPGGKINLWGIDAGFLQLPDGIEADIETLKATHLAPETFYLDHDTAINLDIDDEYSSPFTLSFDDCYVELKKCSYCGRNLPVDSENIGSLAFHKHNAKLSNHQNECRACKKWRINDSFNPLRTTDQLHESSVITRERKLLLREPTILQEIKKRTGAGLKSQIWERFDRKCFYCDEPVALEDMQLDHTRPLAYLWPIDEHATSLCATHNNQKKEKFPIDFYTSSQLERLAEITGLDLNVLRKKEINQDELSKIIQDIEIYAQTWDSRTFNAIAKRVKDVEPTVDLFEILKEKNENIYNDLIFQLEERPPSVDEEF